MRYAAIALCLLFSIGAQQRPSDFSGYWVAEFKGKPYVKLEINATEPFSGSIETGSVNADAEGDVSEVVESAGNPRKLIGARVEKDGRLLFSVDDSDYEMKIVEAGKALLKIDAMPIKPFPLSKRAR